MIDKPKHGEIGKDECSHTRWCSVCNNYHGSLYICEHYSQETKAELKILDEKFKQNLRDSAWIKGQIDNGVPPEVIDIYKVFMGID